MSRCLSLLALGVFLLVIETRSALGNQPDPCSITPLKFALASPDVPEECGEEILLESTGTMPLYISFSGANQAKNYSLVMVDPNSTASNSPTHPYILHWLVENIPGAGLVKGDWVESELYHDVVGYSGPSPPRGRGDHQYQFYLYEQVAQGLTELPDITQKKFMKFDVDQFVEANNLGAPVAGFEYLTQDLKPGEL